MRIQGRLLRPSNLAERRVLKTLGIDFIRCRRSLNPFAVARAVKKVASGRGGDLPWLKRLLAPRPFVPPPIDLPDSQSTQPDAQAAT